jgi:hypothetical protein
VLERVQNTVKLTGIGNNLLHRTLIPQKLREGIDKWEYMKTKVFSTGKKISAD